MEMADGVKGSSKAAAGGNEPKRRYDSSRRQAQARETQRLIADAARELFIERGYHATSIRDIADAADVALQTIYNAFDGKAAIVARIADIAVVGDDEPVALLDREALLAVREATDPGEVVQRWAQLCTDIFVRFLPILPMLREAAMTDETVGDLWRANVIDNRYRGAHLVAQQLGDLGGLRPDLTVDQAADLLWTVASFDSAEALMGERGWTPASYAEWIGRSIAATLLDS
jgi:TetR/AcrR family transcriptional regulator of autoinduction and epiphytic fitness